MRFHFYTKTNEGVDAMLNAIINAKKAVHFEQFIFNVDPLGIKFMEALRERARAGLDVRLMIDTAGSNQLWTNRGLVETMERDGVKVLFFNELLIGTRRHFSSFYFRDHSKLLIIDNMLGFTGGMCIAEEMLNWRDTLVEIEGEIVMEMEDHFKRIWNWTGQKWITRRTFFPNTDGMNYIRSLPLPGQRHIYYRLIDAIRESRKHVYLTTPYFVPDRRLLRVLILAVKRGVQVELLVPYSSNHRFVDYASENFFERMLKGGIKIYRYKEGMIHSKTVEIDEEWATVGSMNLDNVSLRYNVEANIVSTNHSFVSEVKREFLEDVSKSELLSLEQWLKRSPFLKLRAFVMGSFSYFL